MTIPDAAHNCDMLNVPAPVDGETPLPPPLRERLMGLVRHQGVRRFTDNTFWLLLERLARLLLQLIVTTWVVRYLGPANFAALAYGIAFAALFLPVAQLGLPYFLVRDLVKRPDEQHVILGTAMVMRLVAGGLVWVIAIVLLAILMPTSPGGVWIGAMICGQLFLQSSEIIDLWFQSKLQSRRSVISRLIGMVLANAVKVLLILAHYPVWTFALMFTVEYALSAATMILAYRSMPTEHRLKFSAKEVRHLLRQGWPFIISITATAFNLRIDQIILGRTVSAYELGLYAAIVPLSQLWNIIPVALSSGLTPIVTKRHQEGPDAFFSTLRLVFIAFAVQGLAVSIVTALAAPLIVHLILGPQFAPSVSFLAVHAFTNVFISMGMAWLLWVVVSEHGKLSIVSTIAGGAVSLVGNLILIPRIGALGAAIMANISLAVWGLLTSAVVSPKIFLLQIGLKPKFRSIDDR